MKPLHWATLFVGNDIESHEAMDKVIQWAQDANIDLSIKALNERNKKEYLVGDQVTLRYFDYEHGGPRLEFVGLKDILDFVMP